MKAQADIRFIQRAASLWPLLIPLLLFLPGIGAFPYPSAEALFSDISLAHYPYAVYLRQSLLVSHHLPLWSQLILSGSPFGANPLSGLSYPPGWLALLLPLPLGFNLLVLLHLLWGGIGMYSLLRAEGLEHPAALLGAAGFEALPKLYAHYGAGHLTLLYAIPWTPWLLWACRRGATESEHFTRVFKRPWEAVFLALIFLADVRWSAYAALLWWGYALFGIGAVHQGWIGRARRFGLLVTQTVIAALLASPLALPLLEFTRLSTRSQMLPADILTFSLPFSRLLGLVFPDFNGFHEYMLYAGQAALTLAFLAVLWRFKLPAVRVWGAAFLLSLGFALGANLPWLQSLVALPLFDLLRVPSRMLFISGISILILASYAVQALLEGVEQPARSRAMLLLTAYAGFQVALCGGVWALGGKLPLNFAWGGIFALISAVWIGLTLAGRLPRAVWLAGLLAICLLDWAGIDRTLFWPRPAEQVLAEGRPLAQYLAAQAGDFRVYSPSYSLPQQTAAIYGLQLADGVEPLQLQSYVRFMEQASGVPTKGYSVTLPPYASGEPDRDNAAYLPDPHRLGLLNVRYVAAEFDLAVKGLELEKQFGSTRLYRNLEEQPRAWVQPESWKAGESIRAVELLATNPDRISLRAAGPGVLVLAEIIYPGWRAWMDGRPVQIETVEGLLRSVRLGPGEHTVEFGFYPTSFYLGVAASLITIMLLAFAALKWRIGKRKPMPTTADQAILDTANLQPEAALGEEYASRGERRWVLAFAGLVMLATTLPYLLGFVAQGETYRFTGFVFGIDDGNSYIAKMLAGSVGDWLFRTPYSAYPQSGLLVYIPYLLLGKLAAPPGIHEQLVCLYHLFRVVAGMLAIIASYDFISYFIHDSRLRRFGLALVCLGGGLGWLLVLVGKQSWLGSLPLDFYSPEAFGFLGLFGLPHLAMARALLLWTLLAYLRLVETWLAPAQEAIQNRRLFRLAAQLCLLWLLAGAFQPLVMVLGGVVMGWHQLGLIVWQRRAPTERTKRRMGQVAPLHDVAASGGCVTGSVQRL